MKKVFLDKNNPLLYYEIFVNKKNRTIYKPSEHLKVLQEFCLAYIKRFHKLKLSVQKSTQIHCNKKWILKMDIKDFFNSIPSEYIKEAIHFVYNKLTLPEKKIIQISEEKFYQFVTLDDKLPTGACTSPYLADMIISNAHREIFEFCRKSQVNFSRYMDDLTFSCDDKSTLNQVEMFVRSKLSEYKLNLNEEKVKYVSSNKQQKVLGVLVNNEYVALTTKKKREIRALFFNYIKALYLENKFKIPQLMLKKVSEQNVIGLLGYIKSVDRKYYKNLCKHIKSTILKFNLSTNSNLEQLV